MFPLSNSGWDSTIEPAYVANLEGTASGDVAYLQSEIDTINNSVSALQQQTDLLDDTIQGMFDSHEETVENVLPLSFTNVVEEPAAGYSFTGNLVRSETPTPTTPAYPSEVGTLVEEGEHAGQYAVVVSMNEQNETIYLDEPLRKIGDYADVLSSDGTITRKIAKHVFTGQETLTNAASAISYTPKGSDLSTLLLAQSVCVCSHYVSSESSISSAPNNSVTTNSENGKGIWFKTEYAGDKEAFAEYAAAQYTNHTPITVWFILENAVTEEVTCPTLNLVKGENTFNVSADAQPSKGSVIYTVYDQTVSTTASRVTYDNTTSHLAATNTQDALNEIAKTQKQQARALYSTGQQQLKAVSLADGESLILPSTNCKKNNTYSFLAKINTLDTILIGQGFETYSGAWAEINGTKLIVHNYAQSDSTVEYEHGLTIESYIYVEIFANMGKADIVIYSNKNTFKQTNVTWGACKGTIFAKSVSSALEDCVFTWSSPDFRKSVWLFGDSYIGLNNPARWATVLRNEGFADNIFMNGYAGETSSASITSLTTALENYGQPQEIIWCLGMNDGADSSDAPSTNYSEGITQLEELCNQYGIELVLTTIPSVPNHSNEKKNEYVRNSGYKYIDFAKAVGAQADGTWYTDMLSTDDVHPTEVGAKALYHRAIADCPELMFPNP